MDTGPGMQVRLAIAVQLCRPGGPPQTKISVTAPLTSALLAIKQHGNCIYLLTFVNNRQAGTPVQRRGSQLILRIDGRSLLQ